MARTRCYFLKMRILKNGFRPVKVLRDLRKTDPKALICLDPVCIYYKWPNSYAILRHEASGSRIKV